MYVGGANAPTFDVRRTVSSRDQHISAGACAPPLGPPNRSALSGRRGARAIRRKSFRPNTDDCLQRKANHFLAVSQPAATPLRRAIRSLPVVNAAERRVTVRPPGRPSGTYPLCYANRAAAKKPPVSVFEGLADRLAVAVGGVRQINCAAGHFIQDWLLMSPSYDTG